MKKFTPAEKVISVASIVIVSSGLIAAIWQSNPPLPSEKTIQSSAPLPSLKHSKKTPGFDQSSPEETLKWIVSSSDDFLDSEFGGNLFAARHSRELLQERTKSIIGKNVEWDFTVKEVNALGIYLVPCYSGQSPKQSIFALLAGLTIEPSLNEPWILKLRSGNKIRIVGKIEDVRVSFDEIRNPRAFISIAVSGKFVH